MNLDLPKDQAVLGAGVGLRNCHYSWVLQHRPPVAWFEIISENFMVPGGRSLWVLDQVRAHYPIAMHGVSLSLGSKDPTSPDYLKKLNELIRRIDPLWVSDHLCWTGVSGFNGHDLWPLPYTEEAARHVSRKIQEVQEAIGRRILIENVSTYAEFRHSEMTEWEFLKEVAESADCHILLDINNIYVNSHNHGFDPFLYLENVPYDRVIEIHLAGPSERGKLLIDTHDHPVTDRAWELYEFFLRKAGARPTLLEWDEKIPEFPIVYAEAMKAQERIDRICKHDKTRPENHSRAVLAAHSNP